MRWEPSRSCLINLELHLILAVANAEGLSDSLETELFITGRSSGNVPEMYLSWMSKVSVWNNCTGFALGMLPLLLDGLHISRCHGSALPLLSSSAVLIKNDTMKSSSPLLWGERLRETRSSLKFICPLLICCMLQGTAEHHADDPSAPSY